MCGVMVDLFYMFQWIVIGHTGDSDFDLVDPNEGVLLARELGVVSEIW